MTAYGRGVTLRFAEMTVDDVPRLEAWQPTGPTGTHAWRLQRVETGASSYVVALDDDGIVASCEVRWTGNAAPEIDDGVPELNGLQVWPQHRQGQGIGSALLDHLEALVSARGHDSVGLGVEDSNVRAAGLYLRRGYLPTGRRYLDRYQWIDADGARHQEADPCAWLVKPLA